MEDVSNKVIFILVVLTVVISVFSTVLLLTTDSGSLRKGEVSEAVTSGKVSYGISGPNPNVVGTGKITYEIVDQNI